MRTSVTAIVALVALLVTGFLLIGCFPANECPPGDQACATYVDRPNGPVREYPDYPAFVPNYRAK